MLYSGAPFRPSRVAGQRLLAHDDFPPSSTPSPHPDGYMKLAWEIEEAEAHLQMMRERLETLRARARSKRNRSKMALIEKLPSVPQPVKVRR